MFKKQEVNTLVANQVMLENGNLLTKKAKDMSTDIENATLIIGEATRNLDNAVNKLQTTERSVSENAKKVSANVRKAADDLLSGLMRIEKQADFTRLEKYTDLIERAAAGLTILAELEKSGKLNKISEALK